MATALLVLCMYVCVYVCAQACLSVHTNAKAGVPCRMLASMTLHEFLRQGLSLSLELSLLSVCCLASKIQRPARPFLTPALSLEMCTNHSAWLGCVWRDLNSDPRTSIVSALSSEPSPIALFSKRTPPHTGCQSNTPQNAPSLECLCGHSC